jgi:hypothetical protein
MGLLKHLLFWPVTGPMFLIDFSLNKVNDVVREELTDDTAIKAELLELQLKLELGDITDDEYVQQEAALMKRLREVREWREEFGMGVAGGPVRVAGSGKPPDQAADALTELPAPTTAPAPEEDRTPKVAKPGEASIELNFEDWHE